MKRFLTLVLSAHICFMLHAQHVVTASGSDIFVIPRDMTLSQAEHMAVEQVKLRIIADHFGTVVGSSTSMVMSDRDGISTVSSTMFSETEVRGEWVETIGEPRIERSVVNNEFVLNVSISGKIRELKTTPIDLEARILRNGHTDECESSTFYAGDYMTMSFRTPVDGYVAIYMTDGQSVQCLYPYRGQPAESMRVKQDLRHVFFSKEVPGQTDPMAVRRCRLGCSQDNELNRIYLVFSPERFTKALENEGTGSVGEMSFEEFHRWLSMLRRHDELMNLRTYDIVIRRR